MLGPNGSPPALEVRDLSKSFRGSQGGLRGLNMTVPQGEIHGFLGRNGAGKTTTMKCIMGLLRRNAGRFSVLGEEYRPESDARLRVHLGYAPELANLPEYLTGLQAIETYGMLRGLSLAEVRKEQSFLVDRLDLTEFAANKVKTYSKGTRARLAVAVAMVGDPEILILDEPTSGLDPIALAHFRDLLKELVRGPGGPRTILLSSHQLSEVERLCGSLTIIDSGRTLVEGPTEALVRQIAGGRTYRAEFRGLSEPLGGAIAALPGFSDVARVEGVPGGLRFRLTTEDDPRQTLAELALEHGGLLLSCERELVSVEDLFLAFVEGRPVSSVSADKLWTVSPTAPSTTLVGESGPSVTGPSVSGSAVVPATESVPPVPSGPEGGPTASATPPAPVGRCPRCGAGSEARDRFCTKCGLSLASAAPREAPPPPPPAPSGATGPPVPAPIPPPASAVSPAPSKRPCPYCGVWNDLDFNYCQSCAKRLPPRP